MPRIKGTTNAQSAFLRTFINKPVGPEPEDWPNPSLLRRWLRRENFRNALQSLLATLAVRSELQLASAALSASARIYIALQPGAPDPTPTEPILRPLLQTLKMAHQRQKAHLSLDPEEFLIDDEEDPDTD